ncbi:diguanylate cyclase [Kangiella sp.]|uniref:diguanylate cyclase domain-containing protein n=1 Tax=Kangiella sp. TaxID=1920245 RepID=UPI0019A9F569|nr:diguanylate cyclase [Kangiella sp.]MBD3653200.1 diguanylate cyclase [Kangiella sp.]
MNTRFNEIATRVVDLLMDVVCVVDQEGNFVYISSTCEKVFGYKQEEMIGTNMINYIHPDDREKTLAVAGEIMRGEEQPYFENRYVRKDGKTVYIMWSARWSENDKVRVAVARDVTEYKRFERTQNSIYKLSQIAHQASDLTELFQQSHQIIKGFIAADTFIVALKHNEKSSIKLAYCSDGARTEDTNYQLIQNTALEDVLINGKTVVAIKQNNDAALIAKRNSVGVQGKGNWLAVPLIAQETIVGAIIICATEKDSYSKKDIKLMEFVAEQITATIERKEYEQKLHHLASHDWLTGLPNRLLFNDRLDVAIKRAKRVNEQLALLYMDLDGFKEVNDTFGHSKGDLLLSKVAIRIQACVRESDTVARMGGDEFTVLLTELHAEGDTELIVDKIRQAFIEPFVLDGAEVAIGISIGIAIYPSSGEDSEALLRNADRAMYDDKRHNNSNKI